MIAKKKITLKKATKSIDYESYAEVSTAIISRLYYQISKNHYCISKQP